MSSKKRKLKEDKRRFNVKWELEFFIVETAEHFMRCLICDAIVKTLKGDNVKQHFQRHSSHRYGNLQGESRKICVENLNWKLRKQTSAMNAFLKTTNNRSLIHGGLSPWCCGKTLFR
ncbi:General transcription factor II-I repeat domain-containing protein 2 [Trichinella papuae]|uniref:General transcription factor II-I repeat domain-containing protein 2 n=1 Tax=Trichinella papuae TaxID=268474 RepID=A0A0V1M0Q6_9BILA|nr:General transcription factor II-I repeat domain-containing protein 2 [Trichinella papuae]